MSRKILSLCICIAMILMTVLPIPVLATPGTDGSVSISASSASDLKVGETVDLTFTVNATGDAVGAVNFTVNVPDGLEYVSHEILVSSSDFMMSSYTPGTGVFGCAVTLTGKTGSFNALKLTLKAKSTDLGNNTVGVTMGDMYKVDGSTTMDFGTVEGLTIKTYDEITGNQNISVTAPVKGNTPQSTIADGTGYTGTISWTPNHSSFGSDTVYTAEIELTAKTGYAFADNAKGVVSGASVSENSVTADGSKLKFKAAFPATSGSTALGGTVSIGGSPVFGQSLTANTSALDYGTEGIGTLSYQWKRNDSAISGATGASYTLTADDVGKTITVTVKNSNNSGSVTSLGVGPVGKKDCTVTPTAAIVSKTTTSVTVTNVISGQEYAVNTSAGEPASGWNTTGSFTGLNANTKYYVYTRVAETSTVKKSSALYTEVTTDKLEQTITAPSSKNMSFGADIDLNTLCSTNASGNTLTFAQVSAPPAGTTFNATTGVVTAGTTAGSFKVKVSAPAYGNYNAAADKEITINVVSRPSQVFAAGFTGSVYKTYGDADFTRTATLTTGNGAITYSSSNPSHVAVDPATGKATIKRVTLNSSGVYEPVIITATAAETAEYAETSVSYSVTVYLRTIVIEWHNHTDRVYGDGKTVTATVKNKVGDDDVGLMVANGDKTNAGTYTATAGRTGADDINYKLPSIATVEFTIEKATPTGAPTYTNITTSGKTLADAAITANFSVPGTVKWVADDGATPLADTTTVEANTYYKWLFTPADSANYNTLTGEIKLYTKSTSIGISSRHTISFDTNGGSEVAYKRVTRNSVLEEPEAPTKEGFIFKGWYTDKELKTAYDFTAKVTSNFTLYAAWEKVDPTVNQIVLEIGKKDAIVFGKKVTNDVAPQIVGDRTMLPARFVAESLGAKVDWEETGVGKGKVTITKGDNIIIVINIGDPNALVNGKVVKLDSPAFIENDRTYTPIRFISEELGAKVEWDESNQKVTITKGK